MRLTHRQKVILHFIELFQKENGWAPTVREIGLGLGISSTSTVYTHLKTLEKKGFIERLGNTPRAIRVLKSYDPVNEMLNIIAEGMRDGQCESICRCECPAQ